MRLILLVAMFFSGISAHAGVRLNCSTSDEAAWKAVQLWGDSGNMLFIIKSTVENRKRDIGTIAQLKAVRTAKYMGRTFINYRGTFKNGNPQNTISIWLSGDNYTMVHLIGSGIEYNCYYDYD